MAECWESRNIEYGYTFNLLLKERAREYGVSDSGRQQSKGEIFSLVWYISYACRLERMDQKRNIKNMYKRTEAAISKRRRKANQEQSWRVNLGKGESKDDQGSRHSKVKEKLGEIVSGDHDSIEVELYSFVYGLPRWFGGKEPACQCKRLKRCKFNPWVRTIPWQPTPVFFPGKSYRQRILVGYSARRHRVKYDLATEHA